MKVTPVLIPYRNRWTWLVALVTGLVISSVITGLSVGIPLGLACCTSYNSTYTQYDGLSGSQSNDLYMIIKQRGTQPIAVCKSVCDSDPACVYFDYISDLINSNFVCFLYPTSELSTTLANPDSVVFVKKGYSLSNSG